MDNMKPRSLSEDLSFRDDISIRACKNYTRLANQTLTSFTDEMSALLQQSIKRLDNISMQVREYMYDIQNQNKVYQMRSNKPEYKDPDEWEITVVKCKSSQKVAKPLTAQKSKSMIEIMPPSISFDEEQKDPKPVEGDAPPKKRRHVVRIYNRCLREARKIFGGRSNFSTTSKRKSIELYYDSLTERHVRNNIREQHQLLKKWMRSSAEEFPEGLKEQQCKKRKRGKVFKLRRNLIEAMWAGPKELPALKPRKETRLVRKSACENLRRPSKDEASKELVNFVAPQKSKEELTVVVHTQKPPTPSPDQKSNKSRLSSADILDELTLRDLEPIKSEYPRKDHLCKANEPLQESLLYKLVNEHHQSLEYLVSIDESSKPNEHSIHRNRSVFTIPEEEPPKARRKKAKPRTNKPRTRVTATTKAQPGQSMSDCNEKRDVKRNLKKAISELESKPVANYIVMPVTVQYDSDVSRYQKKKTVEDILRPYIYFNDAPMPRQDVTVMTLTVEESKQSFKNKSPTEPSANGQDCSPILVQRFVTCNQGQELENKEPREQMISFVVNEDKKHLLASNWVMNAEDAPTQKSRRRLPNSQEIKSVINKMENRLKEASKQPRKNQLKVIENEMQNILSKMQFDPEDIDLSSTSTSTSNSFMKLTKRSNLNLAARLPKKPSLPGRFTPRRLSTDSSADTLTPNLQKINESPKELDKGTLKSYKKITGFYDERSKAEKPSPKARTFLSETKVPTVDAFRGRKNAGRSSEAPKSLARLEKYLTDKIFSEATEKRKPARKAVESDNRVRKKSYFEKGSLPGEQVDAKVEEAKEENANLRLTEELGKETRKLCSEIDDVIKQMQEQQELESYNCESRQVPPPLLSEVYKYETFKKQYFNAERLTVTQSLWRLAQAKHLAAEQYLIKHVERRSESYSVESLDDDEDETKGVRAKSIQVSRELQLVGVDKMVQFPLAQLTRRDVAYSKMLTFVYGLIFAVVFGGLNYKYFCA